MQLNCLFWNAGRKTPDTQIAAIAKATGANVIALAEYAGDGVSLMHHLSADSPQLLMVPTIGCDRIRLITAFQPHQITHRREADRYTIKELSIPGLPPILLCLAHLPSKLHADDLDQLHTAWYFKQDIEGAESDSRHTNTVVFGDFNMTPFDDGMVAAAAMNSLPCLATAQRESRVIAGRSHTFFYNPTWNLLGDFSGPPGTYFHASPGYRSRYWNMLDQVIIRPSIGDRFNKSSLSIVTSAGAESLLSSTGRPTISDHLPIFFSLNLA